MRDCAHLLIMQTCTYSLQKVDVKELDKLFMVVHVSRNHWALLVVCIPVKRIDFYDR